MRPLPRLAPLAAPVAAAVALSAALVTVPGAPAQAATGWDRCPVNRVCVFTGNGGTGTIGIFATGDGNLADRVGPAGLDNKVRSVWNRRAGETWLLYIDAGYRGMPLTRVDSGRANRGNVPDNVRNRISSLKNIRA